MYYKVSKQPSLDLNSVFLLQDWLTLKVKELGLTWYLTHSLFKGYLCKVTKTKSTGIWSLLVNLTFCINNHYAITTYMYANTHTHKNVHTHIHTHLIIYLFTCIVFQSTAWFRFLTNSCYKAWWVNKLAVDLNSQFLLDLLPYKAR